MSDLLSLAYPPRKPDANKGDYGRILFLCGASERDCRITGAPMLALSGAYRTGAGLCTLLAPEEVVTCVSGRLAEPLYRILPRDPAGIASAVRRGLDWATVAVIGCGLSTSDTAKRSLTAALTCRPAAAEALVLDADGLNLLAQAMGEEKDTLLGSFLLQKAPIPRILTPHPLELVRLLCGAGEDVNVAAVQADRIGSAKRAAALFDATVVLKGAGTVIASPDGQVTVNDSGTPAMAKGGSGDVLAGMIGAVLASPSTAPLHERVAAAVYLHGLAGQRLERRYGQYGVLPSELPDAAAECLCEYTPNNYLC